MRIYGRSDTCADKYVRENNLFPSPMRIYGRSDNAANILLIIDHHVSVPDEDLRPF